MTTTNHRHERVGEEIAHEINAMLAGGMKHARVYVNVKGSNKEQSDAIRALEHAVGYIRSELIERLQLRRLPEMHFTLDTSQEHVERIEQLLKEMKKDKPAASSD